MRQQIQPSPDVYQNNQSGLSIILITAIVLVGFIYLNCTYTSENEMLFQAVLICPAGAILTGIYTFTYRGKKYRASRILFYVLSVLSIAGILMLWYLLALGQAFQH